MSNIKKYTVNQGCMSLSTYFLEYGRHVARLRRRAYAPTNNTASHDNHLTNRFHVAVHLSSNRSQMTSKCGENKKVAHEAIAECVTDVLTTF